MINSLPRKVHTRAPIFLICVISVVQELMISRKMGIRISHSSYGFGYLNDLLDMLLEFPERIVV